MIFKKKFIVLFFILVLVISGAIYVLLATQNRKSITIKTDTTPVRFELNDTKITLDKKVNTVTVDSGIYTYRAIATVDGKRIVYTDKINLSENDSYTVKLRYAKVSKSSILDIICSDFDTGCPFKLDNLAVTHLEDNTWIVVDITSETLGKSKAVLSNKNGNPVLVDGPGTDLKTGGYYPESVERAIKNAQ